MYNRNRPPAINPIRATFAPRPNSSTPLPRDEGGIDYEGTFYPYNYASLLQHLRERRLTVGGQIAYLEKCLDAYSIERPDLLSPVIDKIKELQWTYNRILSVRTETRRIEKMADIPQVSDDITSKGVKERNDAEGFVVVSRAVEVGDMRSLQNKLMETHLLTTTEESTLDDPLLVLFGMSGFRKKQVEPLVWLGKNNQLHYLIDTLCRHGIIQCDRGRKWEVAAPLFINGKSGQPYTTKQLASANTLSRDDEQAVQHCIPKLWIKKQ